MQTLSRYIREDERGGGCMAPPMIKLFIYFPPMIEGVGDAALLLRC